METADHSILDMRGITKRFPGVLALDGVDFDLFPGEVHVLLGENGAGKSTLMKILSGACSADEGSIVLDRQPVEIRNPRAARELGIAAIYQELNLVPQLSAAENIFLGREPGRPLGIIDQRDLLRESGRFLEEAGAGFHADRPVRSLSVAEQQLVEIAKALSLKARILIMDEPTSALADAEIGHLFATIRKLQEKKVAIIYISHRLEELFRVGTRVTVLRDGRYIATLPLAQATVPELVHLMAGRELKEHFPRVKVAPGEELLRVEKLRLEGRRSEVSLTLRRGEILGIAGLLGSGRTELARAIFGASPRQSGRILIKGKPVRIKSPAGAIRAGLGFLSEDRKQEGLILGLSVRSNISLPSTTELSRLGVVRSSEEDALARRFVSELRIKATGITQVASHLSGGNQQKVVLSKWLGRQSEILIFDEPTRGIDVAAKVEIYQLMNRLTASGVGIIMISSELPEILGMSDRILVMQDGALKAEFAAEKATQEKILQAALGH